MLLWPTYCPPDGGTSSNPVVSVTSQSPKLTEIGFKSAIRGSQTLGLIRFGYVVFAASAAGAGVCANSILYEGQTLYSLRGPIAVFAALLAAVFLSPVLCFVPTLLRAKRKGLLDYGAFAMKYMQSFDRKWVKGEVLEQEALLGSPDIQALADLDNSFQIIRKMRVVPLDRKTGFTILAAAVAPFLPLLLTVFSLEELVKEALKMLL